MADVVRCGGQDTSIVVAHLVCCVHCSTAAAEAEAARLKRPRSQALQLASSLTLAPRLKVYVPFAQNVLSAQASAADAFVELCGLYLPSGQPGQAVSVAAVPSVFV